MVNGRENDKRDDTKDDKMEPLYVQKTPENQRRSDRNKNSDRNGGVDEQNMYRMWKNKVRTDIKGQGI